MERTIELLALRIAQLETDKANLITQIEMLHGKIKELNEQAKDSAKEEE